MNNVFGTNSPSLAAQEAYLAEWSEESDVDEQDLDQTEESTDEETAPADTTDSAPAEEPAETESTEDDSEKIVMAKDGKNSIPFSEFQKKREAVRQAESAARQAESSRSEEQNRREMSERKNELYEAQLSEIGMTPNRLPEEHLWTDERAAQLNEEYPDLAFNEMNNKFKSYDEQMAQLNPSIDQVIETIPELAMMDRESEDWQAVIEIENELVNSHSSWQKAPTYRRLTEVVKIHNQRTQAIQDKAKSTPRANSQTRDDLPDSPSEIGQTSTHRKSDLEFRETASNQDLSRRMANMTNAEIERFLSL